MSDDAGVGKAGSGVWDGLSFAVKGDKGTATEDGWLNDVMAPGAGVGGRFELDPESAQSIVEKANWAALELQRQAQKALALTNTQPPADDPGSRSFNEVGLTLLRLGADHIHAEWLQHRELAEKLAKALDVYKQSDEQAGTDVENAGGDTSGGGMI
ncbi:hypothetical protein [Prauserella rugosa]|uniref:Uncharacterized protein n=1 Tax=Prauserella rugosa TaxID=43354 RepID=A0A660CHI5_9PSEU|nr:hypothetical protein [Prauserella rugosa]KID29111.1 hypothetical protein HQ32_03398 [Prauserella sp. Am3]KMS84076.1 hypothetical protein ACZ91_49755 [Streptomyces regensis]TWH21327.1 hypothetical protein JD82_03186 [Prauserella rugosa]